MKQRFDLDDFESFLSEQAEQHRMYPSDRVWSGIRENLHANEKWPSLTFTAILTTALIAITLTIFYPNRALLELPENFGETVMQIDNPPTEIQSALENNDAIAGKVSIYPSKVPVQQVRTALQVAESIIHPVMKMVDEIGQNSEADMQDAISLIEPAKTSANESAGLQNDLKAINVETEKVSVDVQKDNSLFANLKFPSNNYSIEPPGTEVIKTNTEALSQQAFIKSSLQYQDKPANIKKVKPSRWSMQIYATPSVSYRYLIEDKEKITDPASGPVAPHLTTSVNEFVRQQPKLGLEVGGAVLYKLADNFRVKTGLQLNYRQYGIDAFASSFQPAMLTLDRGNSLDSIVQYTNISNQAGYKSIQLSNKYLQLAIPVGFDLRMASMQKVEFYVSAASQFTYQIASSSYLLSSDFKNYMKQPDLNRKFNMNAAIEAFASFEAGGVTWQAGPQIRYQLLPGTKDVYNIQEHLIDYGFKIGVVKNFK
jgi:hypothetical protein